MRRLLPLVITLSFAAPATAAEPANDLFHLMRGVVATGAQVSAYAACWAAIDDEETCVKLADRAMRVISD